MELKVFTLPTCPCCPAAKLIVSETEGLAYDVRGTPSIAIDTEVIVRGRLISREKLEEEVSKRLEKWKVRVSSQ